MTTITIRQKMSGTGNIHDLASDQFDRSIKMDGYAYAVIAPAYYNLTETRHKTEEAAIKTAAKLTADGYESVTVVSAIGDMYEVDYYSRDLRSHGRKIAD